MHSSVRKCYVFLRRFFFNVANIDYTASSVAFYSSFFYYNKHSAHSNVSMMLLRINLSLFGFANSKLPLKALIIPLTKWFYKFFVIGYAGSRCADTRDYELISQAFIWRFGIQEVLGSNPTSARSMVWLFMSYWCDLAKAETAIQVQANFV